MINKLILNHSFQLYPKIEKVTLRSQTFEHNFFPFKDRAKPLEFGGLLKGGKVWSKNPKNTLRSSYLCSETQKTPKFFKNST